MCFYRTHQPLLRAFKPHVSTFAQLLFLVAMLNNREPVSTPSPDSRPLSSTEFSGPRVCGASGVRFRIEDVESSAQGKMFLNVPRLVYRNDANWVQTLRSTEARRFQRDNSWFSHGRLQRFIAVVGEGRGKRAIGRIVAAVNDLVVEKEGSVGLIGYFECTEDFNSAQSLLEAACNWLRAQGMKTARTSIDLSTGNGCMLLTGGFDSPPMVMMPYNPPYYPQFMERAGWQRIRDAYAYIMPLPGDRPPLGLEEVLSKAYQLAQQSDVTFRRMRRWGRGFTQDCSDLYDFTFGTMSFDGPEKQEFMTEMRVIQTPFGAPGGCIFAHDKGQMVGAMLAMPDYNIILKHLNGVLTPWACLKALWYYRRIDQARLIILGALPAYRRKGVAMALVYLLGHDLKPKQRRRFKRIEMSYVFEDNLASRAICEMCGGEEYKTYSVYEKRL